MSACAKGYHLVLPRKHEHALQLLAHMEEAGGAPLNELCLPGM